MNNLSNNAGGGAVDYDGEISPQPLQINACEFYNNQAIGSEGSLFSYEVDDCINISHNNNYAPLSIYSYTLKQVR
jgi:hypothetical protein